MHCKSLWIKASGKCKCHISITSYPHVPLAGVHLDGDYGDAEMSGDADDEDDDGVDYGDVSDDEPLSIFLLLLRNLIKLNCSCFVKLFFFLSNKSSKGVMESTLGIHNRC